MLFRFLTIIFLFPFSVLYGQISIKHPVICHDKENYLKCYNDGTYILKFENGDFNELKTVDSTLIYSNTKKEFTIFLKLLSAESSVGSIKLKLLDKSILIQHKETIVEISSLAQIQSTILELGLSNYLTYNETGINYGNFKINCDANQHYTINVHTFHNNWNWDIKMMKANERFYIDYNPFKKNRLFILFIANDSLKYGMVLSNNKKIARLYSNYTDSIGTNAVGHTIMGNNISIEQFYNYDYDKKGKLVIKSVLGELKECDCN